MVVAVRVEVTSSILTPVTQGTLLVYVEAMASTGQLASCVHQPPHLASYPDASIEVEEAEGTGESVTKGAPCHRSSGQQRALQPCSSLAPVGGHVDVGIHGVAILEAEHLGVPLAPVAAPQALWTGLLRVLPHVQTLHPSLNYHLAGRMQAASCSW